MTNIWVVYTAGYRRGSSGDGGGSAGRCRSAKLPERRRWWRGETGGGFGGAAKRFRSPALLAAARLCMWFSRQLALLLLAALTPLYANGITIWYTRLRALTSPRG